MSESSSLLISQIDQVVVKHSELIRNLAKNFFQDEDAADDVVQEVLLKIDKSLPKTFENEYKFQAWISQITKNYCKDVYRKNESYKLLKNRYSVQQEWQASGRSVEDEYEIKRLNELINLVLADLNPEEQEIYKMYAFSNYSLREIQKKSGKKLSLIRYIIERVNKNLFLKAKEEDIL